MKSAKKILKWHYVRKAVIYFLTWCLILNTSLPAVMATPAGGVFTVGTGTIVEGANTAVTVNQGQSVIQWGALGSGGIDTSAAESLTFLQAAGLSNSAVLNRIMSGNPTQFNGALNGADMRVFIVNPAGIVFGSGSTVNVSQLIASGLNMSDADFLNATDGTPANFRFEGGNGQVSNRGIITANGVYLIGKKVNNNGGILARNGLVVMAAGDNVYLAQDGSSVVVQVADVGDGTPDVDNRSLISAPNGQIVLAAGDTFSRAIRNVGWIVASSGTITAKAARIENRGLIRTDANPAGNGDGGTVTLTGTESLLIGPDGGGLPGTVEADAGINGNGGNITLETEGTLTVAGGTLISARGGSSTGNGGSVKITAEHFAIAGQIDASPANTNYNPGTLEIDPATVTIANGANAGATDTLYEQDIETWGTKGTNLIVYADNGITIEDIADGRIAGRYGDIELYATGVDSSISFADTTNTISTTQGDIKMSAGSGGLTIGSLETGDINLQAIPGQIALSTHDGGNITTENLTIKGGRGHAEINVAASGDLTVNGDVIVGRDSAIQNIPLGQNAEAFINLKAGDSVVLNGDVRASSNGANQAAGGSVTRSYIGVFSGTGQTEFGDTTINGDLVATAKSSSGGTSEATIEIDAWGLLTWGPQAAAPVADGDEGQVHVASKQSAESTNTHGDVARVIVKVGGNVPEPVAMPDLAQTHMGTVVTGNVLTNDTSPKGGTLAATLVTTTTHGTLTLNSNGTYTYRPQAGYVGPDSFTYTASADGATSDPVSVTITMTNTLPVALGKESETHMGISVQGTILDNVSDPDGDPFTTALVTTTTHGTLTLKPDGTYSYTPQAGYVGPDSFTYSAVDGQTGAVPVQATVTINMTNSQPLAEGETQATHMGHLLQGSIDVSDPDGDPFTTELVTTTTHGTLMFFSDGGYLYTPQAGYVGPDTFTYSAVDNQTGAVPIQGTITINVTNTLPVITSETLTTHMGVPVKGTIADNITDPEDDLFTVGLITTTTHGTLKIDPDGSYTYQPQAGYIGPDTFEISAWDTQTGAEPVPVTMTINMTNNQPSGVSDTAITTYISPVVIGVLGNDADSDRDKLSVNSFSYTGPGALVLNANGTFTYTPPTGFLGKDSFTYSVTDGQIGAELTETTVNITVDIGPLPPPESFMPTGPKLDKTDMEVAGCPALLQWAASELGVDRGEIEVWMVNGLASGRNIQPCEACGTLRHAAMVLSDAGGVHAKALTEVINEYGTRAVAPSEEQMASIAETIAKRARPGNRYALAGEYVTALSEYVTTLSMDIGFSAEYAVKLATNRYLAKLTKSGNTVAATYVAARLDELSVFLTLSEMEALSPNEEPAMRQTLDFDMMR